MARSGQSLPFKRVQILYDKFLGSGAYGTVYRGKCDELPCAVKLLHSSLLSSPQIVEKFKQECDFFASIIHPSVVQFLGVHEDPKSGQPALLMELMDESLTQFLKRHGAFRTVPLHIQVDVCHDVVLALHYLHSNGIIYRDLSSNNVLLIAGRRAKITDLGVAKLKDALGHQLTSCPGSPPYMPPEALKTPPQYTEKLDVFSFGVLLLQIVTRNFPEPDAHETRVADATSPSGYIGIPVSETDRRHADLELIPQDHPLQNMVLNCLDDDPNQRPSTTNLCQQLEEAKESSVYGWSCSADAQTGETQDAIVDEIARLKQEVSHCQETIKLKDRELQMIHTQTQSQPTDTGLQPESPSLSIGNKDRKAIHGLNPQLVSLLSKSTLGELAGVLYNHPEEGVITVTVGSAESLDDRTSRLLDNYQYLANQSQQLELFVVPPNCTVEDTKAMIASYNNRYRQLCLSYISDIHAIQVVSICPTEFSQAQQQLQTELTFTIYMEGGRKLGLRRGNIVQQTTEVIVNAANKRLYLGGGIAGAINSASHGQVQKSANAYFEEHGELREGQVAVTPAGGDLQCQWVIHAVGAECSGNRHTPESSQRVLREAIGNSLTKAEELKSKSIAIPPISTGHFNMNSKLAANAIINSVIDHDYTNDYLREVLIVIIDEQTFSAFEEVFLERKHEVMLSLGQGLKLRSHSVSKQSKQSGCRTQ